MNFLKLVILKFNEAKRAVCAKSAVREASYVKRGDAEHKSAASQWGKKRKNRVKGGRDAESISHASHEQVDSSKSGLGFNQWFAADETGRKAAFALDLGILWANSFPLSFFPVVVSTGRGWRPRPQPMQICNTDVVELSPWAF
jgi:hypothetical protein